MKKTKMLKKNYEFHNVLSKGNYYTGKQIEAFIVKNNENINYLGLAISVKKGKANKRNKVKRLLRENYKILEKNIKTGNSIIFLLKRKCEIQEVDFYSVNKDMTEILKNAKLL